MARFTIEPIAQEQPAQSVVAPQKVSKPRFTIETPDNPTEGSSFLQNALEGTGMGMAKIGRAVGQAVGLVSQADIDEANRLDQALANTAGGKIGNIVGQAAIAAPTMLIPGANTALGAAAIGSGVGALTTEGGLKERALGAAMGGAGALAGVGLGKLAGKGLDMLATRNASKNAAQSLANTGKDAAARLAQEKGLVLPPSDVNPTALNELLNGISGKIKTAQAASAKNQGTVNTLVKKDLGLGADEQISRDVLNGIRKQAGQAYENIKSIGEVATDNAFLNKLDALAATERKAAIDFPKAASTEISDMVDSLKVGKFDAGSGIDQIAILRDKANAAYAASNKQLGNAYKGAANALEDQIDRHLDAIKAPGDMIRAFRNARQTIAKTYTVEKALNDVTGDVSSASLASALKKGKPLSGGMRDVAEVATAFPKAMQTLSEAPKAVSPLDMMAALMTGSAGGAAGGPLGAAGGALTMASRPAIRSAILSAPYQRNMVPSYANSRLLQLMNSGANNAQIQALTPGLAALLATQSGQ